MYKSKKSKNMYCQQKIGHGNKFNQCISMKDDISIENIIECVTSW